MIYVPNLEDYDCFVVNSSDTIRAYETTPTQGATVSFRDYYINSSYIYKDGTQNFSQYSSIPVCLVPNELTNDVFYRNDIDKILVIFFIILLICFYFPYKIISRLFGRWLKI